MSYNKKLEMIDLQTYKQNYSQNRVALRNLLYCPLLELFHSRPIGRAFSGMILPLTLCIHYTIQCRLQQSYQ